MRKLKFLEGIRLLTAATAILLVSPVYSAEYYTWIDENGVTNYAERKPQGYEASYITPDHRFGTVKRRNIAPEPVEQAPITTSVPGPNGEDVDPDALVQEERAKYEAELAEERRHNCELGKQNLARLQAYSRVRVRGDDGKMRYLTDSEMEAKKQESRDAIKFHCRG